MFQVSEREFEEILNSLTEASNITFFRKSVDCSLPCFYTSAVMVSILRTKLIHLRKFELRLVLGRYWFYSSVPVSALMPRFMRLHGTGSVTSVWYLLLDISVSDFNARFSGDYLPFSHFGTSTVLFRFHFGFISTPNQVEPKALVLQPKLTGT